MAYDLSLYVDSGTLTLRGDPYGAQPVPRIVLVQGTSATCLMYFMERRGANYIARSFGSPLSGTLRVTVGAFQAASAVNDNPTTFTAVVEPLTGAVAYACEIDLVTQNAIDLLGTANEKEAWLQVSYLSETPGDDPEALLSVPVTLRRNLVASGSPSPPTIAAYPIINGNVGQVLTINAVNSANWQDPSGGGSNIAIRSGNTAISNNVDLVSVLFSSNFASVPVVTGAVAPPNSASPGIACWPVLDSITVAGCNFLLGANTPSMGYRLMTIAVLPQ